MRRLRLLRGLPGPGLKIREGRWDLIREWHRRARLEAEGLAQIRLAEAGSVQAHPQAEAESVSAGLQVWGQALEK